MSLVLLSVSPPDNPELLNLLSHFVEFNKLIAAVCHGPMGLVNLKGTDGQPFVSGRKVRASAFASADLYVFDQSATDPCVDALGGVGGGEGNEGAGIQPQQPCGCLPATPPLWERL